jgi:putative hydrolase of the HAD superfamily
MFADVRAITFDLDDTLWPCHTVIAAAEQATYAWLTERAPRLVERYSTAALREHRIAFGRRRPEIAHDLTALRLHALAELMAGHGYDAELARQASDVFRAARNRVTPYADVVPQLARLRRHYTLISVTNGNAQVEQTPLRDCFDHSLSAAKVGAAKPDPAIFHAARSHAGVGFEAFLHVGDDPLRDVAAARALGMPTAWVNRSAATWPEELARPDLVVGDLCELADMLMKDVDGG